MQLELASQRLTSHARVEARRMSSTVAQAPAAWAEACYYAYILYGLMSPAWGISVPMVSAGGLALLAAMCWLSLGSTTLVVTRALTAPVLCASTFVAVQIFFHGESVLGDSIRPWVTWILALVVVQSLALRRGFIHRFAGFAFCLVLIVLPYLQFSMTGLGIAQAGLDRRITIGNSNNFAAWVGFCCLYFAVLGLQTKYQAIRTVSWICGAVCALIVGLTVSRGTLLALVTGLVTACRRVLKRGFFPVLALCVALWIAIELGIFDGAIQSYTVRGTVETGRLLVWPLALQRVFDSPLIGYGVSDTGTYVPQGGAYITTHNSLLYLLVAAGIVPALFYIVYLSQAFWRTLFPGRHPELVEDQPFRLPLLVYLLLITQSTDNAFMAAWAIATLTLATSAVPSRPARRFEETSRARPSARGGLISTQLAGLASPTHLPLK